MHVIEMVGSLAVAFKQEVGQVLSRTSGENREKAPVINEDLVLPYFSIDTGSSSSINDGSKAGN